LRGKILRIHPEPDGTYTIPAGNLFAPGTTGARPEIYVMGCRNPYRIHVDGRSNVLYWGEVGPDAGTDSLGRGPRGYDEFNRADRAGNYGWPLVIGNGKPYHYFNFAAGQSGEAVDPQRPRNRSANNTGLQELPPARPATIWYPYDDSPEFPQLGKGGRNAIGGPVYYAGDHQNTGYRFPPYYDGKWFIADWMRNWIFTATLDADGNPGNWSPSCPPSRSASPLTWLLPPTAPCTCSNTAPTGGPRTPTPNWFALSTPKATALRWPASPPTGRGGRPR
jgi:cytochrome c